MDGVSKTVKFAEVIARPDECVARFCCTVDLLIFIRIKSFRMASISQYNTEKIKFISF